MCGKYLETISKGTSVKEIGILRRPTKDRYGRADFTYQGVYSVFDRGTIKPPVPLDNSTVCIQGGFNFEKLEKEGIPTHYLGLINFNGEKIRSSEIPSCVRHPPVTTRLKFVNRIMPKFHEGEWDYGMFGSNAEVKNYVHPIEFMVRNELPESSSVWGRVDRGEITLQDLGLPNGFKKGDLIPEDLKPILDYSTKFEPEDRYISADEARRLLNMSEERFENINNLSRKISRHNTELAASRGFKRLDGKYEYICIPDLFDGNPQDVLADEVCTWHSDRIVTLDGFPISKQNIRNKVKKKNPLWFEDLDNAKLRARDEGVEDFRDLMNPDIKFDSPDKYFFEAINNLFRAATNQWMDRKVYNMNSQFRETSIVDDLEKAIEDFKKVM